MAGRGPVPLDPRIRNRRARGDEADDARVPTGPVPVRCPDGRLGLFVPPDAVGWLILLFRFRASEFVRGSGGRPPESFWAIEEAALAAASGRVDGALVLDVGDLEASTSARGSELEASAPDPSSWLSTAQVADRLAVSPEWVRARLRRGDFPGALRVGRDWMVPEGSVMPKGAPPAGRVTSTRRAAGEGPGKGER